MPDPSASSQPPVPPAQLSENMPNTPPAMIFVISLNGFMQFCQLNLLILQKSHIHFDYILATIGNYGRFTGY